jgi:hypothetical protein
VIFEIKERNCFFPRNENKIILLHRWHYMKYDMFGVISVSNVTKEILGFMMKSSYEYSDDLASRHR